MKSAPSLTSLRVLDEYWLIEYEALDLLGIRQLRVAEVDDLIEEFVHENEIRANRLLTQYLHTTGHEIATM
jgi:hypothetical protein